MTQRPKYGIGEQDFKSLRDAGCVYVDKTQFIERIITSGVKYYFLARPRRFGKSLFLSTLYYFFEGQRDLFRNLYIDSTDWDWSPYPVLRLDLNMERYAETGKLSDVLEKTFRNWELKYGVDVRDENPAQRFRTIIETAHEKTGKQVVVLVDEYDKPLVGNMNNMELFERYREELASLYSNFKSAAEHIRLVFLTGVSRFSKLSVFSDLNNIVDITFENEFADVCGVTEKELYSYFRNGVEAIAVKEGISFDRVLVSLKKNYDGYRFAQEGSEIYNPWSLLNAMKFSKIGNFWNETGFPTLLAESLKRVNADLKSVFNSYCSEDDLKGLDLQNPYPQALLYQTGYLTIKEYNKKIRRYLLGIPNNEVRAGFFNALLPYYVNCKRASSNQNVNFSS